MTHIDLASLTPEQIEHLIRTGVISIDDTTVGASGSYTSSRRRVAGVPNTESLKKAANYDPNKSEMTQHLENVDNYKKYKKQIEEVQDEIEEFIKLEEEGVELSEEQLERKKELIDLQTKYNNAYAAANSTSSFRIMTRDAGNLINSIKALYSSIKQLTDPWAKADAAASKYAKTVAMSAKGMENLRKDTINNVAGNNLAIKYNTSTEELLAAQENYIKASGRNIRVSNGDQENIAAMEAVAKGRGIEMAALMDNFGVGVSDTADRLGKMFSDASKEGISFEKYSDNVAKNIKLAQNYTFKNGLKGLESMAKKATAMKMDMQQVATLADNVSTVEGSIDVASKLQVLGGSFAQLADPLGMLNEGLNDMEGLQDRLIKMVGGLGTFNKETGEVEVSAFNKQRVKAAAKAMGVSYDSLMESATAQARRGEISKQIESSEIAKGLSDEMKELIKNTGTFKDGKAGVSIRGQFKSLDQLTEADKESLKKETQTESEDIKDIAYNTRSLVDIQQGREKQTAAWQAQMVENTGTGDTMKNIESYLGESGWFHGVLTAIQVAVIAGQAMSAISNLGGMFRNVGGLLKNGFSRIFKGRAGGVANRIFGGGNGGGILKNTLGRGASLPPGTRLNSAGRLINASTGRFVSTKGLNMASGAANRIAGTAGSTIFKGGVQQTAKRALIKTVGKNAAGKVLGAGAKIAAGTAASAALAGPLGLVGMAGDMITDSLVASGKMKKGGTGHHVAKGLSGTASGAAIGATVGSIIPVIGTLAGGLIGGAIGGIRGLFKAGTAKKQAKLERKFGVKINGDYGRSKTEQIGHALKTGYISDKMRKKLEKNGDQALLAKIDQKAAEQRAKGIEPKKMGYHEGTWGKIAKTGLLGPIALMKSWGSTIKSSKTFNRAMNKVKSKFYKSGIGKMYRKLSMPDSKLGKGLGAAGKIGLGTALLGPIGGLAVGASMLYKNYKKKENSLKHSSGKSAKEILDSYKTNGIKPIPEKGTASTYGGVDKTNKDIHIKSDPHNINLNGTLNLRGENGQSVDLISDLKKNPDMMRNLAGMVSNEMSVIQKGANVIQR